MKTCIECSAEVIRHHKGPRCSPCHNKTRPLICTVCGETGKTHWHKGPVCGACRALEKYRANPAEGRRKALANYRRDKRRHKEYHLRRSYGISLDEYEGLVSLYGGKCNICKEPAKLFVDHCHKGGDVRGLLCLRCNSLLGYARDNVGVLLEAASYLKMRELIKEAVCK